MSPCHQQQLPIESTILSNIIGNVTIETLHRSFHGGASFDYLLLIIAKVAKPCIESIDIDTFFQIATGCLQFSFWNYYLWTMWTSPDNSQVNSHEDEQQECTYKLHWAVIRGCQYSIGHCRQIEHVPKQYTIVEWNWEWHWCWNDWLFWFDLVNTV